MAHHIELRCDVRFTGICEDDPPVATAGNSLDLVRVALCRIHAEARDDGWQRIGRKWACPKCYAKVDGGSR